MPKQELIRTWRGNGFQLFMFDTGRTDYRGQTRIAYKFYDHGELIFEGEDFAGSPMHADDHDLTVAALLSFLALKPGDTDPEFFEDYTDRQLEWADERGEELSFFVFEIEEAYER